MDVKAAVIGSSPVPAVVGFTVASAGIIGVIAEVVISVLAQTGTPVDWKGLIHFLILTALGIGVWYAKQYNSSNSQEPLAEALSVYPMPAVAPVVVEPPILSTTPTIQVMVKGQPEIVKLGTH